MKGKKINPAPRRGWVNRRRFLKEASYAAAGVIGFPYFISASALGKAGRVAASERIVMGCIGTGGQGRGNMGGFMGKKQVRVVAVCDPNGKNRNQARDMVNKKYGNKDCAAYNDFRELLGREDIEAVSIGTPDHWHAIPAIAAAKAGKDIFCEKPLSLTIAEARVMVDAVRRYGRVFQTGSQQRSSSNFRFACELVRNGYIGEVKTVTVNIGGPSGPCNLPAEPQPVYFDWDMWLGQAPWRPFNKLFHGGGWRAFRDYSGGGMTDWGAHHFDIAQWGLGMDDSGPVEIIPPDGKDYKVLTYRYANGVTMTRDKANGVLFTGTKGKVEVNRGYLRTWPDSLKNQQIGPNEIHLYESRGHKDDFLECVRTRRQPICDVEIGCRSVTVCHLGNLAYQLKRPLKWDPENERFVNPALLKGGVNDEQANRMLWRPMRSPWHL